MRVLYPVVVLVAMLVTATAQDASKSAPKPLTEVQKLTLMNKAQANKIAELQFQQAAVDYQRTKQDFDAYMATLKVDGYELNDKLEYVAKKKDGAQ